MMSIIRRGIFVAILLLNFGIAQSATVRFNMNEEKPNFAFSAYILMSGSNVLEGASSYSFTNADSVEFWAEIAQGWVQFAVTNPQQLTFYKFQNYYSLGGSSINLSETTTNPGLTTNWRLLAIEQQIPGIPNDYAVALTALDGSQNYQEFGLYSHPAWLAVPVPPAIWLFGSALAGLGWLRRKQTV